MCSLSIISASAETFALASEPCTLRPESATMNPRESALSSITSVGASCEWCGAVLAPNGTSSLLFQPPRGQRVVAVAQPGDETYEAAVGPTRERARDVGAVAQHTRPRAHRDQRVATRDQVGAVGEHVDLHRGRGG